MLQRTWLAMGTAAVVVAAMGSGPSAQAGVAPPGHQAAAVPVANMEAVLKAAQIDPRRADNTLTPGCGKVATWRSADHQMPAAFRCDEHRTAWTTVPGVGFRAAGDGRHRQEHPDENPPE